MMVRLPPEVRDKAALAKFLLDVWSMPRVPYREMPPVPLLINKSHLAKFDIPLGSPEFSRWQHDNAIGVARITPHAVWLEQQKQEGGGSNPPATRSAT